MIYTKDRPPVIKANLGQMAVAPTCTVVTDLGVVVQTGSMTLIPNTPIWYFVILPASLVSTKAEYAYYITDPDSSVLDEGTFSVEDNTTNLVGAITTKDFDCPSVIATPGAVTGSKTYTIRFRPTAADGTFVPDVTEIGGSNGPKIEINFKNSVYAATQDRTGNMILQVNMWIYDWTVIYTTPADIVRVTISCEHVGKQYTYQRHTEIVNPREFNPQRLSVGTVG